MYQSTDSSQTLQGKLGAVFKGFHRNCKNIRSRITLDEQHRFSVDLYVTNAFGTYLLCTHENKTTKLHKNTRCLEDPFSFHVYIGIDGPHTDILLFVYLNSEKTVVTHLSYHEIYGIFPDMITFYDTVGRLMNAQIILSNIDDADCSDAETVVDAY